MLVTEIIEEFSCDPKQASRERSVAQYKNCANFQRVLDLLFNPAYVYDVEGLAIPPQHSSAELTERLESQHLEMLFDLIDDIVAGRMIGTAIRANARKFLGSLTKQEQPWFYKVILKTLDLGVRASEVKRILPELPIYPCHDWPGLPKTTVVRPREIEILLSDVQFPVWAYYWLMGMRVVAIKQHQQVQLYTEHGVAITNQGALIDQLNVGQKECVLMGILRHTRWRSKDWDEPEDFVFNVEQHIPVADWERRACTTDFWSRRLSATECLCDMSPPNIPLIAGRGLMTVEAVKTFYEDTRRMGYKGIVVYPKSAGYSFDSQGQAYAILGEDHE